MDRSRSISSDHYIELDAIRGLAACIVFSTHLTQLVPGARFMAINPFVRGQEAVILFFVLSGLVLSLPFHRDGRIDYLTYIVKRVCRIYLPYLVFLGGAMLAATVVPAHRVLKQFSWLGAVWMQPLTWDMAMKHVSLIGWFKTMPLNPVIWSLVHEMRVSLVFPFILVAVTALPWWSVIVIGPVMALAALGGGAALDSSASVIPSLLGTCYHLGYFILGAMLGKHLSEINHRFSSVSEPKKLLLLFFSLGLYLYSDIVLSRFHTPRWVIHWLIALGAATLLCLSLNSRVLKKVLRMRPLLLLGQVSYSLYLTHIIVILAMMYTLHSVLPFGVISLMVIPVAFVTAYVSYRYVERPSIALGRAIVRHIASARMRRVETTGQRAEPEC